MDSFMLICGIQVQKKLRYTLVFERYILDDNKNDYELKKENSYYNIFYLVIFKNFILF